MHNILNLADKKLKHTIPSEIGYLYNLEKCKYMIKSSSEKNIKIINTNLSYNQLKILPI